MQGIKRNIPRLEERDSFYYARWYDEKTKTAKRHSLRTKDESTARIRLITFIEHFTGINPLWVREILKCYIDNNPDIVDLSRLRSSVKALTAFMGNRTITSIDVPLCREYAEKRGVSPATIARDLGVLKAAANFAVKWKVIRVDQLPVIEMPKSLPKRETWLLRDELETLKDNADDVMYAYIRIMYYTGSRKRAIETMEWSQVDFNRKTISLAKHGERKTNKRRPTVPMGDLEEMLQFMYDNRENDFVLGSTKDLAYKFKQLAKECGLLNLKARDGRPEGKLTPHLIRHSRATHLLEKGVSIYTVAKLLGDNVSTVETVYGHVTLSSMADQLVE